MKILFIIGSGRRNGNTDHITAFIKDHLAHEAKNHQVELEVETIYLSQQDLQFCRGCRICYDSGEEKCPVKDDIPNIKAKMMAADGILIASPVYVDDVSGMIKTLIDRLCHACHRPQFSGKAAFLLATTGGTRTSKTLDTMKMAVRTWGYHVAGQSGYKMGALMKPDEMRSQFGEQAARDARRLFAAIYRQEFLRPSFFALMIFKIQQSAWKTKGVPGTPDYRHWVERGWLDEHQTYYIKHDSPRIKVTLARIAGIVIAKIMT
jgi:multimeric flavodoxin WrbA